MKDYTPTDVRRITHMLTYVFDRDHFLEQPFTTYELYVHLTQL